MKHWAEYLNNKEKAVIHAIESCKTKMEMAHRIIEELEKEEDELMAYLLMKYSDLEIAKAQSAWNLDINTNFNQKTTDMNLRKELTLTKEEVQNRQIAELVKISKEEMQNARRQQQNRLNIFGNPFQQ